MKSVVHSLIAIAAFLTIMKLLVLLLEPRLTFFPYREIDRTPADFGIEYQELSFPTSDGETLSAWFLDQLNPLANLVFFHGNGGNISVGCMDYLVTLHRHGYSVFVFDYRGYGKSSGSPSEEGFYLDSRAAVSYFWKRLHRNYDLVLYLGHSLGGVAAACAAEVYEPDGLILQGSFPDKGTLLFHYPLLRFLGFFSRYKLSTLDFTRNLKCAALVIHGERDRVVPLAVGRRLFEQLEMNKEFYLVKGAGHADLYLVGGDAYWNRLHNFIQKLNR